LLPGKNFRFRFCLPSLPSCDGLAEARERNGSLQAAVAALMTAASLKKDMPQDEENQVESKGIIVLKNISLKLVNSELIFYN